MVNQTSAPISMAKFLTKFLAVTGVLAGSLFVLPVMAQSVKEQEASSPSPPPARKTSPYRSVNLTKSAIDYYKSTWGVDKLLVRQTASGNLIRFSYRVTDTALAKALGDKKATPYLIGQRSHAMLQIPVMDKVGQLRQTGAVEAGKEYWMAFSNKGNLVKVGERVDVRIGSFHADGLIVE